MGFGESFDDETVLSCDLRLGVSKGEGERERETLRVLLCFAFEFTDFL